MSDRRKTHMRVSKEMFLLKEMTDRQIANMSQPQFTKALATYAMDRGFPKDLVLKENTMNARRGRKKLVVEF